MAPGRYMDTGLRNFSQLSHYLGSILWVHEVEGPTVPGSGDALCHGAYGEFQVEHLITEMSVIL